MGKWEMVRLGDVCSLITDGTHQTPEYCSAQKGYPFLSSKDVITEVINWDNLKYIPKQLHEQLYKRLAPQVNDILLAKNGTTGVALVDKNCIFDIYVSLALLRPMECIRPKYLLRIINSPLSRNQFNVHLKGIGVPNLHLSEIRNTRIPLPSLDVQQKIADVLDKASALIELRRAQLDKLDLLIKSQFIEMFGDPVTNPMRWNYTTLDKITEISSSKRIFESEYVESGVPFFRTKEIVELSKNKPITTELFISKERYDVIKQEYKVPKTGDLLVSAVGTIGVIWVVNTNEPFYFKDGNLLWIQCKKTSNSVFMKYLLTALIDYYKKDLTAGSAYSALTIVKLKQMRTHIPPLELQNEFTAFVERVEINKRLLKQSLTKLERSYKSLMQKCFRGEIF